MTFYEAAVEVLKSAQRPLNYKAITHFAINRGLLGHIGHTPDVVMASCLIRAATSDDPGEPVVCLENGTFALRGWPDEWYALAESPFESPVAMPAVHIGLLPSDEAAEALQHDDIQFRQSVKMRFEADGLAGGEEDDADLPEKGEDIWPQTRRFDAVRKELNAQQNEHYNVSAAIVKILRSTQAPMRSAEIAATLSRKCGAPIFEQAAVLAMRADNALRVSRGKRAVFVHIPPDMWTLSENFLARHILKIESKLYDMSRQLRAYSIHALAAKIRELDAHTWQQLATIILKHLNYTIQSQYTATENEFILRAEEVRGLSYIPVVIKVILTPLVGSEDITQFRDLIRELRLDHGVLLTNGDISKDALNECTTRELPIYAYSARQIAPIMFDARIGVVPHELPIVFIDNNFFQSLSTAVPDEIPADESDNLAELFSQDLASPAGDLVETDSVSDEYLFDDTIDVKESE